MATYILRRILWMVPTMLGITFILFVVMQLAPGDPATVKFGNVGGASGAGMSSSQINLEDVIAKFRSEHHLDDPLWKQYGYWLRSVVTLDFGYEFSRPSVAVMDELKERLKVTVPLSLASLLLSYVLALPLGIYSAVRQRSLANKGITLFLFLLYSLPTFWVGLMLILVFGATGLHVLPVIGLHDKDAALLSGWPWYRDLLLHCILPIATLSYGGLAYVSRQMRIGMLDTVRQDYIRTARAKGLSEKTVVFKHALRNSLIPSITVFAQVLPIVIGGSVIVEQIFNLPGVGLYAYEGLLTRDYNVVMATTTVEALLTLICFLLSDILYAALDPRISYD